LAALVFYGPSAFYRHANPLRTEVVVRAVGKKGFVLFLRGDSLTPFTGQEFHPSEWVSSLRQKLVVDAPIERPPQRDDGVIDGLRFVSFGCLFVSRPGCRHHGLFELLGVETGEVPRRPVAVQDSELFAPALVVLERMFALLGFDGFEE
jgi:hypothetical protein